MGPASHQSDLPLRPRFAWDIRSVPWTDGRGNQDQYASAVALWKAFHNKLPDANSNKIPKDLQGIMLQSQLYGRARDLCKSIPDETIQSEDGSEAIVNKIHQRDPLAVVSDVYQDFITLLNTKRGNNESFQNFGTRFEAQVSKFSSHCDAVKLPEALTAFMLLANSGWTVRSKSPFLLPLLPETIPSILPLLLLITSRRWTTAHLLQFSGNVIEPQHKPVTPGKTSITHLHYRLVLRTMCNRKAIADVRS